MDIQIYKDMDKLEEKHFWFKARRNIIETSIKKYVNTNLKELDVLEIGSGTGGNLVYFSKLFKSIKGIEYDSVAVEIAKGKTNNIDIWQGYLPYKLGDNHKYDLILLCDVLEHVKENEESLQEIRKLLKDDGKLLITVPAFMFLWSSHDVTHHHVMRYNKKYLLEILKKNGYKVKFSSYFNFFLFPLIFLERSYNKIFRKNKISQSDMKLTKLNGLLYVIFNFEKYFLRWGLKFPFGVSLIAIANKKK